MQRDRWIEDSLADLCRKQMEVIKEHQEYVTELEQQVILLELRLDQIKRGLESTIDFIYSGPKFKFRRNRP